MAAPDAAQACIQVEHREVQQEVQEELPDVCDMRRHGEAGVAEQPGVVWVLVKTHGGGGMERGGCDGGPGSAECDNKDSKQKEGDGSGTPFSIRNFVASVREADVKETWPFTEGLLKWRTAYRADQPGILPSLDSSPLTRLRSVEKNLKQHLISEETSGEGLKRERTDETEVQIDPIEVHGRGKSPSATPISDRAEDLAELVARKQEARECGPTPKSEPHAVTDVAQFSSGVTNVATNGVDILVENSGTGVHHILVEQVMAMELDKRTNGVTEPEDGLMKTPFVEVCKETTKYVPNESNGRVLKNHRVKERSEIVVGSLLDNHDTNDGGVECRRVCNGFEKADKVEGNDSQSGPKLASQNGAYHERDQTCSDTSQKTPVDVSQPCGTEENDDMHSQIHNQELEETAENMVVPKVSVAKFAMAICKERSEVALEAGKGAASLTFSPSGEEGVCPVCRTFTSPSNTALNAHIDQCLVDAPAQSMERSNGQASGRSQKFKVKAQKKRSLADLCALAPRRDLEDSGKSHSGSRESSPAGAENEVVGPVRRDGEVRRQPRTPFFRGPMGCPKKVRCSQGNAGVVRSQGPAVKDPDDLQRVKKPKLLSDSKCTQQESKRPMSDVDQRDSKVQVRKKRRRLAGKPGYGSVDSRSNFIAGFTETSSTPLHGQNSSGTGANKPSLLLQAVFSNSKVNSKLEDSKVRFKEKKRADAEEPSRFGKRADAGDKTSEELALDVVEPAAGNLLDGSASARCLGSGSRHSSSPGADETLLCQGTKGPLELKTSVGSGQCSLTVSPRASGGSKISSIIQPSGGPKKKRVRLSTTASISHNWKSGSASMVGVKAKYKKFQFNLPPKLPIGQESPRNEQIEVEGGVRDYVEPLMKETTRNPSNKEPNITGSTDFPSPAKNTLLPKQKAKPLLKSPVADGWTPDDRILQQPVDAGKNLVRKGGDSVSPITKSLGRSEWRKEKLKRKKRPRLPNTPKDAPILIPRSNAILREVLGLKQYFGQGQASLPSHTREPVGISTENQLLDSLHHSVSTGKRQLSESSTRLHLGKRTETRKGSEVIGGPHETAAEAQRLGGRDIAIGLSVNNAHEVSDVVGEIEEVMVEDLNHPIEAQDPTSNSDIHLEASSAKLVSTKPTVKGALQQAYNTTKGKKAPIKVAARSLSGPINSKDITEPAKKLIVPPRGPGGRFISPKVVMRDATAGDATDGLSYTQSEHTPNSTSKVHKTKAYSKLVPTLLSPGAFRPQPTSGGASASDLAVDPLGWSGLGIGGSIVQEPQLPSARSSIAADDICGSGEGTDRMVPIIQGTATDVDGSAAARKGNFSSRYSRDVFSLECCNGGTATRASLREGTAEQSQSNSSQPSDTNPAVLNQAQTNGSSQLMKGCTSGQPVHGVTSPVATPQVISSSETGNGANKGLAVIAEKPVTPGDAQVARLPGWMLAALTDQQQLPLGSGAELSRAPHVGCVLSEVKGQDGGRANVPPSPETLNLEHAEPGMVKLFGNPVLRLMGRNVLVLQEENSEDFRSSNDCACGTESSGDLQAGKLLETSAPPTAVVGRSGMATEVFQSPGAATAGCVKEVDLLKGGTSAFPVHKKSSLNHPASLRPQEAGGEVLVVPWHAGDANQRATTAATSSGKIGEPDLRLHTKSSRKGRSGDIELRPGTSLGCLDLTSSLGSLTPSMAARGENANNLAIHNKVRRASSSNGPAPGQEVIVIDDLPSESPRRAAKHVTLSVETLMKVGALRPLPSEVDKQTVNAKAPGSWGPVMELDCSRIPQLSGVSQSFLLAELRKLGLVPATHVDSRKTAISEQRMVSRGPNSTTPSSTPLPQHATVSEITTASLSGRLSTLVSATKGAPVSVGKIEVLPPWLLAAKKQKEARMAANLIVLDDEDDPPILPSRGGLLGSTESQVPGSTGLDSRIAGELFGGTQENSSNEPSSALSEVSLASCRSKGVLKVAENNMILGSPMNAEMSRPSSRPINQSGGNFNPSATTQDSIRTAGNSTSTQQPSDLLQTATSSDYELSERERGKSLGTTGKGEQVEKTGKNVDPPVESGGSVISFLPPSWMVGGNPGAKRGAAAQACKAAVAFLSKSEAAPQVTQLETLGPIDGLVVSGVPQVTRCSSLPLQRFKPEEEASAVAKAAKAIGDGENPLSHVAAQSMFLKHSMSLQRPRHFTSDLNEKKQRCNGSKGTSLNNVEHEMKQVGTQVLQSHLGKQQQLNQDIVFPLNATESNVNQALTRSKEESKAAGDCTSPNHSGKQSSVGQGRQHPVSINYTRKDVPDLMTMTPLGMQVARNAFYREKQPSSTTNLVDPPYTTPPISSTTQITLRNSEARCRADNECQAGAVGSMPDLVDDIILSQVLEKPKEFVSPSGGLRVGVGLLDAVEPTVAVQNSVKAGACIHPPDLVRSLSAGGDRDVQIEHNCKSPPVKCVRGAITGNSVNLQVIVRKPLSDPVRERSPAADLKKILSSNSAQPSIGSSSDVFVTEHTGCLTGSERRSADIAAAIESSAITTMGQADDKPQPGTRTNTSEAAHLEHASRAVPSEGILNTGSAPSFPVGRANSYASLRQQSEGPDKLNLAGATAMNASDISTSSPSILDVRKMVKSHPFNVHKNVTAMKTGKGAGQWLLPPSAQPLVGSIFSIKFKFHERGASVTLYQERLCLKSQLDPNGTNEEFELFLSSMTLTASHSSDVVVQANIAMPDSCETYSDALDKATRLIAIALVFLQASHWEEYWQPTSSEKYHRSNNMHM